VVHADEQLGFAQSLNILNQKAQLLGMLVVAREENYGTGGRMAQAGAVVVAQRRADDVDDRGAQRSL
jgi:hypothetical protein